MSPCISDALTVAGLVVGGVSLILTILIYRWTNTSDDERQAELLDILRPEQAALGDLSPEQRAKLNAALEDGEVVQRITKTPGKGNHPWYVVTNRYRVLTIYSGGRKGGVHLQVLVGG